MQTSFSRSFTAQFRNKLQTELALKQPRPLKFDDTPSLKLEISSKTLNYLLIK